MLFEVCSVLSEFQLNLACPEGSAQICGPGDQNADLIIKDAM